jgi:hypothetical protein
MLGRGKRGVSLRRSRQGGYSGGSEGGKMNWRLVLIFISIFMASSFVAWTLYGMMHLKRGVFAN